MYLNVSYIPCRGAQQGPELAILAEMATCQLEYTFLAKETGKKEFFDLVSWPNYSSIVASLNTSHKFQANNVNQKLYQANLSRVGGMFPIRWNIKTARPFDSEHTSLDIESLPALTCVLAHLSVGAQADSAHEYLLKQYLLTAKTDKASLEMCPLSSIPGILHLILVMLQIFARQHTSSRTSSTSHPPEISST
jgi:hypothetical protein